MSWRRTIDVQARFESMKRNRIQPTNNATLFRRHQDLERDCKKKIQDYEKETRYNNIQITRVQGRYEKKAQDLENLAQQPHGRRRKNQPLVRPPKLNNANKRVFLFRIEKRDGATTYIEKTKKKPLLESIFQQRPPLQSTLSLSPSPSPKPEK